MTDTDRPVENTLLGTHADCGGAVFTVHNLKYPACPGGDCGSADCEAVCKGCDEGNLSCDDIYYS